MARSRQLRELAALLSAHEPRIARAFEAAIHDVRGAVNLQEVINALARGDIDGAMRWLTIGPGFLAPLDDAVSAAYIQSARASLSTVGTMAQRAGVARAEIRFDARAPRAEAWLGGASASRVVEIGDASRNAIRGVLAEGMRAGENPTSVAREIVGRINRATGRRDGGLIGLTDQQMGYVRNARAELASGDPAQMSAYFQRVRRDRRYDRTVRAAIREGRPVSAADIDMITGRYSDRLLKLRGETIGRTEALQSLNAGAREALEQAVESGAVQAYQVRRVWRTASDDRVRDSHAGVNGESVGMNERFSNGLLYPGEPGAPASEVIGCRCIAETRIDFWANLR